MNTWCFGGIVYLIVTAYVSIAPAFALAQVSNFNFEHLTTEDGLSSNKVVRIIQDRDGFYWIATQNGLNRFDGTSFKVFRHIESDSSSLSHNYCTDLAEDAAGDIWVSTYRGLSRYRRNTGTFEQIYLRNPSVNFELANRVSFVKADRDGNVWIGGKGLWRYLIGQDSMIRLQPEMADPASPEDRTEIAHMAYDSGHEGLWLGTGKSLLFYHIPTNQFYSGKHNPLNWSVFENADGGKLAVDAKYRLWFTDRETQMLSKYDVEENSIVRTKKFLKFGLRDLQADDEHRLWIYYWLTRTEIFDTETLTTDTNFMASPGLAQSELTMSIFIDRQQNYWIASRNGIDIYNENNQYFRIYTIETGTTQVGEKEMRISAFAQTDPESLWIGSDDGLFQYIFTTSEVSPVTIPFTAVTSLHAVGDTLWIGGRDKLCALDATSGKIYREFNLNVIPYFIQSGSDGLVWVGTWSKGLVKVDPARNDIQYLASNPEDPAALKSNALVSSMVDGQDIWVGYNGGAGFSRYDGTTGVFTHFYPLQQDSTNLSAGTITVITRDGGNLWLGTYGSGIFLFDAAHDTYQNWNQEDGLRSDFVNSIVPDARDNLWISTADGLSLLSKAQGNITPVDINLVFRSNNFFANGMVGRNKNMYFYCDNKIVEISPDRYQPERDTPGVVISGFKIFDRDVVVSGRSPQIVLTYRENFFSFEFSLLRTDPDRQVLYASRLAGFEDNWNTGSKNFASYTNVPHGAYSFEIKCAGSNGQWSDVLLSVPVRIRPAFWQTWWFRVLCILAFLSGIWALYMYRVRQIRRIYALKAKISQDLHDDVGASLSSIHIYSTVAERSIQNDVNQAIEIVSQIKQNSHQALENMSDIVWSMNTEKHNRESLADRVKNFGSDLLSYKNIECSYDIDEQVEKKLRQPEARKKLLLIIKEALNNIAKYSEATHAVISIALEPSRVTLRISDNGKGFDINQIRLGNGLKNMQQRASSLGGSLVINSSPGKGTDIACSIPVQRLEKEFA